MSRISLSAKAGRALLGYFANVHVRDRLLDPAIEELRTALAPRKPKPMAAERKKKQAAKKATKRERKSAVDKAIAARAPNICECGCGLWFRGMFGAAQNDHFFGRARSESVETCWRIRADCHLRKGESKPDRATWLRKFIAHCAKHGYAAAAEEAQRELDSEALVREAAAVGAGR